jgi:hypothetical protein
MHKVIVERPRLGGLRSSYTRSKETIRSSIANEVDMYFNETEEMPEGDLLVSLDMHEHEAPSKNGKIRPTGKGADRKFFNENLMPLWRFLRSQVGRCWDDVYSEIRATLSPASTVQMHVVQHLKWQVVQKTFIGDDGKVWAYDAHEPNICLEKPTTKKFPFYVHPVTRILCESPNKSRRVKKETNFFQIELLKQFRLINGTWFVVEFEVIPEKLGETSKYGMSYRKFGNNMFPMFSTVSFDKVGDLLYPDGLRLWKREKEYGAGNIRAIFKRLLGRREEKQLASLLAQSKK